MIRKRLHPCRDCQRGHALWPMWAVCEKCFNRSVEHAMAPFVAQAHAMIEALEKMRRPAKGTGR